jgi:hypothetical protein
VPNATLLFISALKLLIILPLLDIKEISIGCIKCPVGQLEGLELDSCQWFVADARDRAPNELSNSVHILIDTTQIKRTQRWIHGVHHPSRTSSHSWMKLSQLKDCTRNMSDGASCWVASWLGIYLSSEHTAKELVSAMSLRRESSCLGLIIPLSR